MKAQKYIIKSDEFGGYLAESAGTFARFGKREEAMQKTLDEWNAMLGPDYRPGGKHRHLFEFQPVATRPSAERLAQIRRWVAEAPVPGPTWHEPADLLAEVDALTAENARLRAVVDGLPKCFCGLRATWLTPQAPDIDGGTRDAPDPNCDTHKGNGCPRGCCTPEELPYAAALRELEKTNA